MRTLELFPSHSRLPAQAEQLIFLISSRMLAKLVPRYFAAECNSTFGAVRISAARFASQLLTRQRLPVLRGAAELKIESLTTGWKLSRWGARILLVRFLCQLCRNERDHSL